MAPFFKQKTTVEPATDVAPADQTGPVDPTPVQSDVAPAEPEKKAKGAPALTVEQKQENLAKMKAEMAELKAKKAELVAAKAEIPDDMDVRIRYLRIRGRKLAKELGVWVPIHAAKPAVEESAPAVETAEPQAESAD